jgi:cytochrome c556
MLSHAKDKPTETKKLDLSADLMKLLRAEMREVLSGVQSIPSGIATANWKKVAEVSDKISTSYIMDRKLTQAQRKELKQKLPVYFKKMDEKFHAESRKLARAARNHDSQLTTFHYYRLIEACTSCHATYATEKFPGFLPKTKTKHHH